ncbi:MAG TPA: hypothetical protein VIU61_24900 [Kofleriaceae bacterium]
MKQVVLDADQPVLVCVIVIMRVIVRMPVIVVVVVIVMMVSVLSVGRRAPADRAHG